MSVSSDLSYLQSLGASIDTLKFLAEDTKDDFEIIVTPFLELSSNANKSFTSTIVFGDNTVELTLRKDLSDNDWWITESGVVNGKSLKSIGRFTLDTLIHEHNTFTYIIVSPYPYDPNDNKLSIQCIAQSSLLIKY